MKSLKLLFLITLILLILMQVNKLLSINILEMNDNGNLITNKLTQKLEKTRPAKRGSILKKNNCYLIVTKNKEDGIIINKKIRDNGLEKIFFTINRIIPINQNISALVKILGQLYTSTQAAPNPLIRFLKD